MGKAGLGGWSGDAWYEPGSTVCGAAVVCFDSTVTCARPIRAENCDDLPPGEVITHANELNRVCASAQYYKDGETQGGRDRCGHVPSLSRARRLSQPLGSRQQAAHRLGCCWRHRCCSDF